MVVQRNFGAKIESRVEVAEALWTTSFSIIIVRKSPPSILVSIWCSYITYTHMALKHLHRLS